MEHVAVSYPLRLVAMRILCLGGLKSWLGLVPRQLIFFLSLIHLGIWAIDFADEFPSADVIGTDLSPIQPSWVPPNLRFLVDDAESTWLFNRNQLFDFIHVRDLAGSIADWPKLLQQAYDHLEPGGWIEVVDYEIALNSDDDTMKLAPNATEYLVRLCEASEVFKKPIEVAKLHEPRLIAAGFEEVKDEVFKVRSATRNMKHAYEDGSLANSPV